MENIRIKKGIEVCVNDNGDVITIPVDDVNFMKKYYGVIDKITVMEKDFAKVKNPSDEEFVNILCDKMTEFKAEIDNLMGANTCNKVFGDIIPTPLGFAEFFEAITPIIEKYVKEREKTINTKYSKGRKGAK